MHGGRTERRFDHLDRKYLLLISFLGMLIRGFYLFNKPSHAVFGPLICRMQRRSSNSDDECFYWSLGSGTSLVHLYPKKQRIVKFMQKAYDKVPKASNQLEILSMFIYLIRKISLGTRGLGD